MPQARDGFFPFMGKEASAVGDWPLSSSSLAMVAVGLGEEAEAL